VAQELAQVQQAVVAAEAAQQPLVEMEQLQALAALAVQVTT
jgi:hypothetical protein